MTGGLDHLDRIQDFLQADRGSDSQGQGAFLRALRALAREQGTVAAREWARRAASPGADYSFLMALHPFLATSGQVRLAILGGPTTAQLRRLVEVFLAGAGVEAEIYEGGYGLFRQEILTGGSGLDAFRPQIVFLATGARDVGRLPALDMGEADVDRLAAEEVADWTALWTRAGERWNATVVQNTFEIAPGGVLGHLAVRHPAARENYLERLNRTFAREAPPHVVLHDLRGLAAEAGARAWFDERFYHQFKMPCGPEGLVLYAHSAASVLGALLGRSRKVLVLDLDNTLWGGVVGDAGPGGIQLGEGSGEGEAFLAFQRYVKALAERGVVLAVCSKNDEARAREPFEQRPDMVLKLGDFACFMANWENKADNLREMARRLDLNLDAFVFVDDNPAERALVRRAIPEVAVPDLPEDPAGYIQALAAHRYFETAAFTREDSERSRHYARKAGREQVAAGAADLDAFLASLHMKARVAAVGALNLERVTQLINKSNQFNLTTRRYTLAQVQAMADSPQWLALAFSLRDALGDSGLISVLLARRDGERLEIDTWLMSCRVLQRGMERFVRNELVARARAEGFTRIEGLFLPSGKNALVEGHYPGLGFRPAGPVAGGTGWTLELTEPCEALATFIEREEDDG